MGKLVEETGEPLQNPCTLGFLTTRAGIEQRIPFAEDELSTTEPPRLKAVDLESRMDYGLG